MFSVLVPTYNQADYLKIALDSILAQTDGDWEALVVNDGSTDHTAEVIDGYAARDPRVRAFHKPNGGTGSALNEGLKHARGRWLCWLSSDDWFLPGKLELHRDAIAEHPDIRFFYTRFRLRYERLDKEVDQEPWGPIPPAGCDAPALLHRNHISGITICIERTAWERVGRFNERYRYAQDYDMWLRLLRTVPAMFLPDRTCVNRNHDGQGSEVFPQACLYDTAAAGIRYLNDTPFENLFPALGLGNKPSESAARPAVETAIKGACDHTSFVYWIGTHAAYLIRTLQWIHGSHAPHELRLWASEELSRSLESLPADAPAGFGAMLIAASAACALDRPAFETDATDPVVLARRLHDSTPGGVEPLSRYLDQFERVQVSPREDQVPPATVALWHGDRDETAAREAANKLASLGLGVVRVRPGPNGLNQRNGLLELRWSDEVAKSRVLELLSSMDRHVEASGDAEQIIAEVLGALEAEPTIPRIALASPQRAGLGRMLRGLPRRVLGKVLRR